jgi:hypothetical protein
MAVAVAKDPSDAPMEAHPDTGRRVAGEMLPSWPEARDLALEAHRRFPTLGSVGWDVALTPDGPVLVEGNPVWCVTLVQMTHARPLGEMGFPELVARHLEARGPVR